MVRGNPAEAEPEFRRSLKLEPEDAAAHYNLGLLLRQVGRYAEALDELRRGHDLGSRQPGWRRDSAEDARDRAAGQARRPAAGRPQGRRPPRRRRRRPLLSPSSATTASSTPPQPGLREALRTDPKLADDRQAQHPYNAACSAALAGCGRAKDDPPPDDAARTKFRGQALGWLKNELAAWSKIAEGGRPGSPRPNASDVGALEGRFRPRRLARRSRAGEAPRRGTPGLACTLDGCRDPAEEGPGRSPLSREGGNPQDRAQRLPHLAKDHRSSRLGRPSRRVGATHRSCWLYGCTHPTPTILGRSATPRSGAVHIPSLAHVENLTFHKNLSCSRMEEFFN